jgi:hypothetical protein
LNRAPRYADAANCGVWGGSPGEGGIDVGRFKNSKHFTSYLRSAPRVANSNTTVKNRRSTVVFRKEKKEWEFEKDCLTFIIDA